MSAQDSMPDSRVVMDVGEGQTTQEAGSWSIRRSLSGGGLPGQARAVSGSSVGSGQVQIDSPAGRSPWTPGPVRPGGRVGIEARADTDRPWSSVARMVAREVSGTASMSRALDVSIEDSLAGLLGAAQIEQAVSVGRDGWGWSYIDAAYAIERVATRAGYRSTTPDSPGLTTLLSVPLTGSDVASVGGFAGGKTEGGLAQWRTVGGRVAPLGFSSTYAVSGTARRYVTVTLRSYGEGTCGISAPEPYLNYGNRLIGLSRHSWTWYKSGDPVTWTSYADAPTNADEWRVQEVQIDYGANLTTSWRARSRINGGAWTAWSTIVAPAVVGPDEGADTVQIVCAPTYAVNDYRILTSQTLIEDSLVNLPLTAKIGASGSLVTAIYAQSGATGWDLVQQVATATLGAVWIDEDGVLNHRGRDALRAGTAVEQVVSEESLEDVPWSISGDEVADRVEVTYRPTVVARTNNDRAGLTVWESTDTIALQPGQAHTLYVDLPMAASTTVSGWLPVWDTTTYENLQPGEFSRWNAFPNSDLTGAQPADDAIQVASEMVNAFRVKITVRNASTATLYVSQLTYRVTTAFQQSEPVTLAQGAPAAAARAPFALDCGAWVHDEDTAREILQWLTDTLSQPLPVLTGVRVVPDMARRLGSIVKVRDRTTALTAKAIITGIDTSHSPGSLEQRLDLTILATTFDDVDTWLTREGVATFDALDARLTALGLTTFDKLDDFLSRLGGTL